MVVVVQVDVLDLKVSIVAARERKLGMRSQNFCKNKTLFHFGLLILARSQFVSV